MSFLLDALRKSEQAGRRRSAPTIHSDSPASPSRETAENDFLPLLAFLVPAFVLMTWFGWQQFQAPLPGGQSDGEAVVEAPQGVPREGESADGRPDSRSAPAPTAAAPGATAGTQNQADASSAARPRTPVEQLAERLRQQEPAGDRGGENDVESVPTTARSRQSAAQAVEATAQEATRSAARPAETSRPSSTAGDPAPRPQPVRPNHIDYWELPDNIRSQMPDLKISVMVYSENPEERFILVNGERLYQGDELQPGLVLREVTREGVIFSFRKYRFIVAR